MERITNTPAENNQEEVVNLEILKSELDETQKRLSQRKQKAIALIGPTGSGKSTLTNILLGKKLVGKRMSNGFMSAVLIDEESEKSENPRMGHKVFQSETQIVESFYVESVNLHLFDLAGFFDTSIVQEIVNSFALKQIFGSCSNLCYIIVIQEADIKSNRGGTLRNTLESFLKTFENGFDEIIERKSAVFVLNKCSNVFQKTEIVKIFEEFIKDNGALRDISKILEYFIKNKDQKIIFISEAVDKQEIKIKTDLEHIVSNAGYHVPNVDSLRLSISNKAREVIDDLIKKDLPQYSKKITEDYLFLLKFFREDKSHLEIHLVNEPKNRSTIESFKRLFEYKALFNICSMLKHNICKNESFLDWLKKLKEFAKYVHEQTGPFRKCEELKINEKWIQTADIVEFFERIISKKVSESKPDETRTKFQQVFKPFQEELEMILHKKFTLLLENVSFHTDLNLVEYSEDEEKLYDSILSLLREKQFPSRSVSQERILPEIYCLNNITALQFKKLQDFDKKVVAKLITNLLTAINHSFDLDKLAASDEALKAKLKQAKFQQRLFELINRILLKFVDFIYVVLSDPLLINQNLCKDEILKKIVAANIKELSSSDKSRFSNIKQIVLNHFENKQRDSLKKKVEILLEVDIVKQNYEIILKITDFKDYHKNYLKSLEKILKILGVENLIIWVSQAKLIFELNRVLQWSMELSEMNKPKHFDIGQQDQIIIKEVITIDIERTLSERKFKKNLGCYREEQGYLKVFIKFLQKSPLKESFQRLENLEELSDVDERIIHQGALAYFQLGKSYFKIDKE